MRCKHMHKDAPENAICSDCYDKNKGKYDKDFKKGKLSIVTPFKIKKPFQDNTLSSKISATSYGPLERQGFLSVEDVKEFIQKLKEEFTNPKPLYYEEPTTGHALFTAGLILQRIDKLAGDALIHSPAYLKVRKDTPDDSVQKSASNLVKTNGSNSSGTHSQQEGLVGNERRIASLKTPAGTSCSKCGHKHSERTECWWMLEPQRCPCRKFTTDNKGCTNSEDLNES